MATPHADAVALTGTPAIDGLVQGGRWDFSGPQVLTYSFSVETDSPVAWSPAMQAAVRGALAQWSAVANLRFVETGSGGDIDSTPADLGLMLTGDRLQRLLGAVGLAVFPDPAAADVILSSFGGSRAETPHPEGDVLLDNDALESRLGTGQAGFTVVMHEIGHALGLKHSSDDGLNGRPTFDELGIGAFDSQRYTLMTTGAGLNFFGQGNAATPMLYDIAAIQAIYGPNMAWHTGNDRYALTDDGALRTIWDAGGVDTFDASGIAAPLRMDLHEGQYIQVGTLSAVAIAFGTTIENATGGSGNDTLVGNDAANLLDGGAGKDQMAGGAGNDRYVVDNAGDVVTEAPGEGRDTVLTRVSWTLGANLEDLALSGTAGLRATGNEADNQLTGNSGNDTLDGGAGADTMDGGLGNDRFVVDEASDVVTDAGGTDTVFAAVSWTLGPRLENLVLQGATGATGTGNALDNAITGTASDDVLQGGAGNDTLDGGGGRDTLEGGAGNDVYAGFTPGEVTVVEDPGGGTDTWRVAGSATLPENFENLVLLGTGASEGIGNAAANRIDGNAGPNVLDGAGGADTLAGGAGDDTYVVAAGTVVVELPGGGTDTALFRTSAFTMPANVENGSLDPATGNLAALGSAGANRLSGNEGANVLDGGGGNDLLEGGAGTDTLLGGAGDDTLDGGRGVDWLEGGAGNDLYYVSAARDQVVELPGGGTDTVRVGAPRFDLPAEVENAVVVSTAGARVTGNALANRLEGGAGSDTLYGGAGRDVFAFTHAAGPGNVDLLPDFQHGTDRIALDQAVFGAPVLGQDLIYDPAGGMLYFQGVLFAVLGGEGLHPALDSGDLTIF